MLCVSGSNAPPPPLNEGADTISFRCYHATFQSTSPALTEIVPQIISRAPFRVRFNQYKATP